MTFVVFRATYDVSLAVLEGAPPCPACQGTGRAPGQFVNWHCTDCLGTGNARTLFEEDTLDGIEPDTDRTPPPRFPPPLPKKTPEK